MFEPTAKNIAIATMTKGLNIEARRRGKAGTSGGQEEHFGASAPD
jgi:hypothetical protein